MKQGTEYFTKILTDKANSTLDGVSSKQVLTFSAGISKQGLQEGKRAL